MHFSWIKKGSSLNQIVMNPIYDYVSEFQFGSKALGLTLLIASFSVIVSSACAFIMFFLDKRRRNFSRIHQETMVTNENSDSVPSTAQIFKLGDMFKFPYNFGWWSLYVLCFFQSHFHLSVWLSFTLLESIRILRL